MNLHTPPNAAPMETRLYLDILPQPDDTTCGPTCLHAVYRYFGKEMALHQVIDEVSKLKDGGTLAVMLADHALRRGFRATIYTYNVQVFDPTWFQPDGPDIRERLLLQLEHTSDPKLRQASQAYIDYIDLGGKLRFEELTPALIRKYLKKSTPILTGLSATYLHRTPREVSHGTRMIYDDVRGEPAGHFVVLCGYHKHDRTVLVADPYLPNPISDSQIYEVNIDRLICAILLGIITYDANLLIIDPRKESK